MRNSMWLTVIGVFAVLALSVCGRGATPQAVDLAQLAGWNIVIDVEATPAERYAAEQFASIIQQADGPALPIVTTTDRSDRHIFIGPGKAMQQSNVGFDTTDFDEEDLRYVARDGNISIAGGRPRGTLYGVYSFLEDQVGVRFLTADHTYVPPTGPYHPIGPIDRFYHPPLRMRWSYYGEINRQPKFAAQQRVNTVTRDPSLGGVSRIRNINHTFFRQIPSNVYGKNHPEYFALVNGKRLAPLDDPGYRTQPCLSNPQVLRIVTEAVLKELDEHPDQGNVAIVQNDNQNYCRCEQCAAIDEREGSPMGSLLTFVNAIADEVAKKHPGVKVGTLAYQYTRHVPKTVRPRPNVQIELCSIECCQIHPLSDDTCPLNKPFAQDIRDWAAVCDDLMIWNYNTNFSNYLLPCPNLRVIGPNVRFFVAHHATGIFMQAPGNAVSTDLCELRNYIIAGMLWDPSRDVQRLTDEFIDLHYGKAAPPIRRYIDRLLDEAAASGKHHHCFAGNASQYGLDASTLGPWGVEQFEQALKLADDPQVRRRVEKAAIGAYRLAISPVWAVKDPAKVDPKLLDTMRPLLRRFLELCAAHHVDRAREHDAFTVDRTRLEQLLK
ncbi:DUF4838 domain-containing protein [Planctomycetales bacterium ZRK34]|nr:DUF4838 domain-containing protein [Planctomycetales bacterium ZRK34]